MKKLAAAVMISVVTVGIFTGCGVFEGKDIGKDAALETALDDAGVKESDTTRMKVAEDKEDGRKIYEVQFDAAGKEYDYEVQASDGRILSADVEVIQNNSQNTAQNNTDAQSGQDKAQGQQNSSGTGGESGTNSLNVAVSMEDAMAIALERVPGASERDLRIKLEFDDDDGVYRYDGDIIYDQKEYDFEIDANTGTILEWSEERY